MNKKTSIIINSLLISLLVFPVLAQVSIGLKEGDWIEYEITYTGTPPQTYPKNARFEIQTIQGTSIKLEIQTDSLDGTENTNTVTFDLEDGAPDFIIIPSNLNALDEVYHEEEGSIEILGIGDYSYEDETRELVYGSFGDLNYNWDRTTGILIQLDQITNTYTQIWLAVNTNIVQTQASELDPMLLYGITIAIVVILVVAALLVFKRKK
jgi:hypothetical protein